MSFKSYFAPSEERPEASEAQADPPHLPGLYFGWVIFETRGEEWERLSIRPQIRVLHA